MRAAGVLASSLLVLVASVALGPEDAAAKCAGGGNVTGTIGNYGTAGSAKCPKPKPKPKSKPGRTPNPQPTKPAPVVKKVEFEHAWAIACPGFDTSLLRAGNTVGDTCGTATQACLNEGIGTNRMVYRRVAGSNGAWIPNGTTCGDRPIPGVPAPPPIPSVAQIEQAFMALPFAQPKVNIQPEGDVTLVNLATFFEAQWPVGNLGPGDISKKVQLLSWSIEFRIDPARYNYDFGDGEFSGPTTDLGGPYPEGKIRHTYKQPKAAAAVKVDAELTGSYRVNGGANWIPLGGVADLQDEPVVTLQVREAKARLYGKQ